MVTKLSGVEFKNCWNAIVDCELFCPEWSKTHYGCGYRFSEREVEENKPRGWSELKRIIAEIEKESVVYYYCCVGEIINSKKIYFIVYGDNAIRDVMRISVQLEKMHGYTQTEESIERNTELYGSGNVGNLSDTSCPLF